MARTACAAAQSRQLVDGPPQESRENTANNIIFGKRIASNIIIGISYHRDSAGNGRQKRGGNKKVGVAFSCAGVFY